MEIKASLKHLRISPRKVRLVAAVVRKLTVNQALDQLKFINKNAAQPILKLVKSAMANAENNFELDLKNLYIKEIVVNEGTTLKRWMPKAHGRATPLRKKGSHINIILAEIKDSGKKAAASKGKLEEPLKLTAKPKEEGKIKIEEKKEAAPPAVEDKNIPATGTAKASRGGHSKIEGSTSNKGFTNKIFRRKSG